jgi:predicted dehydrogenase
MTGTVAGLSVVADPGQPRSPVLPAAGVGARAAPSGLRIGVLGCGYWGSKHVRVLNGLREVGAVVAIDSDPARIEAIRAAFRDVEVARTLDEAIARIDALVIATPPSAHVGPALAAIAAGRPVLIEKPLATSLADARLVCDAAARAGVPLMVGHTFEFNPVVRELKRRIGRGELGQIRYVSSARLNLGLYRPDVNVVWDLAPHDISILNFLLDSTPVTVDAWGKTHARAGVEDLAYIRLNYARVGVTAYIQVSWLDPRKVRSVTVVGSRRMAVYDDLAEEPLRIYDRGIEPEDAEAPSPDRPISYRYGDIVSPHIAAAEPLAVEDRSFVEAVLAAPRPAGNAASGLAVVAVLEAIDAALATGRSVAVAAPEGPAVRPALEPVPLAGAAS